MRRGGEQVLDEILLVRLGSDHALAPAALGTVVGHRRALDEALVRDRDDAALVGHDVFHAELGEGIDDLGAARLRILPAQFEQLLLDDGEEFGLRLEDTTVFLDQFEQVEVLGLDLVALQTGELIETQFEDRPGLPVGERVPRHQFSARVLAVAGAADETDEVIEVVEGDLVALEDVGAVLGLAQTETGATSDHIAPVGDVALDELLDVHLLRPLLVEGQQDDAKGGFQGGLLKELVDDDLRLLAALELDHDPGVLVGFVAKIPDAVEQLVGDELGDACHQ